MINIQETANGVITDLTPFDFGFIIDYLKKELVFQNIKTTNRKYDYFV